MSRTFTAKDVLLYLFSDCKSWKDVDGDAHDDGTPYAIVSHTIHISDSHLSELMEMAGMGDRRPMETVLDCLKRHNEEDLKRQCPTPDYLTELG